MRWRIVLAVVLTGGALTASQLLPLGGDQAAVEERVAAPTPHSDPAWRAGRPFFTGAPHDEPATARDVAVDPVDPLGALSVPGLVGLSGSGSHRIAMLRSQDGVIETGAVGEVVFGWRVQQIGGSSVVLIEDRSDQTTTLQLFRGEDG